MLNKKVWIDDPESFWDQHWGIVTHIDGDYYGIRVMGIDPVLYFPKSKISECEVHNGKTEEEGRNG